MSTWDQEIFTVEVNADFLDELAELESDEVMDAVRDAVLLGANQGAASEDEELNGQAAATIAAIWAGAPFSAGEVVERYPFIRMRPDELDEKLTETAAEILEAADTELDREQFIEALS